MEIVVTGGKGKLATAFSEKYSCYSPSKVKLDVLNINKMYGHISSNTKYILHTAAVTSVEKCETDKQLAYNVNVIGTRNVIDAIKGTDIKLIYISTPCVFDGKKLSYNEDSLPNPENYYGLTKMIAEEMIKSSGIDYLIIRCNFVARERWPYPKAFTDRHSNYLFADEVADRIMELKDRKGTIHIFGDKVMSMFELAKITTPDVKPMTMDDYHGEARLTKNMILGTKHD